MKINLTIMIMAIAGLLSGCNSENYVKRYYAKHKVLSDSTFFYSKKLFEESGVKVTITEQRMSDQIWVYFCFPDDKTCAYFIRFYDNLTYDQELLNKSYSQKQEIKNKILNIIVNEEFNSILRLSVDSRYEGIYMWEGGVFLSYGSSNKNWNSRVGIAYYYKPEKAIEGRFLKKIDGNVFVGHLAY